jgi:hypothetical protein
MMGLRVQCADSVCLVEGLSMAEGRQPMQVLFILRDTWLETMVRRLAKEQGIFQYAYRKG